MSKSNLKFDPDNTLAGGLHSLTPREAVSLAIRLCEAVENAVGADGSFGSVWPGNITPGDNDRLALGDAYCGKIAALDPDPLEFVAPEQFWNGKTLPQSDVYSIGLMLYTALNHGVMPFFDPNAEHTADARAYALQNRMKGSEMTAPRAAGRELFEVIRRATAFQPEDRYEKPAALKLALESLPEGAAVPAATPFIPLSPEELKNARNYKVDKEFEPIDPEKPKKEPKRKREPHEVDENMDAKEFRTAPRKKNRWILPLVLILIIIAASIYLLRGCRNDAADSPVSTITPEPTAESYDSAIHPPVDETTPAPVESEKPAETATPTETPAAEPTYEFIMANVTWEEAKALCEAKGGHLATVKTAEQLAEIIAMAEENGANYVWLGAYRGADAKWRYVTGEALDYTVWDTGEPSAMDTDGTREDYLLLWYRKNLGTWSYNDMRNDPISVASNYRGKLAYVCQYDK